MKTRGSYRVAVIDQPQPVASFGCYSGRRMFLPRRNRSLTIVAAPVSGLMSFDEQLRQKGRSERYIVQALSWKIGLSTVSWAPANCPKKGFAEMRAQVAFGEHHFLDRARNNFRAGGPAGIDVTPEGYAIVRSGVSIYSEFAITPETLQRDRLPSRGRSLGVLL
jgi:hypothetical protein